jgi:opacity protein-like surface antigen
MKKIYCTLLLLVPFLLTNITMAQGLKFGIGGGLSFFSNSNATVTYNTGYNVGAKLKLEIPMVPLTPVAFVNYHFLSATIPILGQNINYTNKLLSFGVGAEFSLLPGPISPYIAADFAYNNFGEGKIDLPGGSSTVSPSVSRTGINVGVGAEIKIPFFITLDGSIKYNMLNLFGKDSGEGNMSAVVINVSVLF